MRKKTVRSLAAAVFLLAGPASFAAEETAPLRLVQTIPLPQVEGRIDHLTVDVAGNRLFVAARGNNSLEVIDLRSGSRIHSISGLREPQGVAYVAAADLVYVSCGGEGAVRVYDAKSLNLITTLPDLDDADNVRYDAATKRVYVGYGSGALAIIDAATAKLVGDVKLAGHPESFQVEQNGRRIFVNVPTAGQVSVVDCEKRAVVAAWPLAGAKKNFPMALDETNRRLFLGCRQPSALMTLDCDSGKEAAVEAIDKDTDDIFYDLKRSRLYISCGAGVVDVLNGDARLPCRLTGRIPTASGARTALFAPELDRLYLAVPHRGEQLAEIRVYEPQDNPAEMIHFDDAKPRSLPTQWLAGVTGKGEPKWTVEAEASAPSKPNVLKQSGSGDYPWCVKTNVSLADGFVEAKFKTVSGKEDQAGGVVWRWTDGNNYYIARANALEDNITIYHTSNGIRRAFKTVDRKVSPNQWHTLRVDFRGNHFTVTFDGEKVIEAEDDTVKGAGVVGVWTKADSVTLFDEFSYGTK